MCGIIGYITSRTDLDVSFLRRLLHFMRHRGPDGEGIFQHGRLHMGMCRLSIIDLENGWQPLKSREGRVVAFQNGEIYNFKALRRELERKGECFTTNSDTEVLAHGYAAWGIEGLLEKIDGMYALAIFDKDRHKLYLARDRFGEKPLFYATGPNAFAYASSLKVMTAFPWVTDNIDPLSLNRYLALHYVPGNHTILRDVKRVLPGEYLSISLEHPTPACRRYYLPALRPARPVSSQHLRETLERAVRSRMVADVPVGVFLSGGLDSSLVAAMAVRQNPSIDTFSMGFSNDAVDESRAAQQVAHHIGSRHHRFVFDQHSFDALLPQVAAALDEPVGDQAMLPLYWLCREARKFVNVVLSGEGADEVFCGYDYYRRSLPEPLWRRRLYPLCRASAEKDMLRRSERLLPLSVSMTPSGFPLLTDSHTRAMLMGRNFQEMDDWEAGLFEWLRTHWNSLQRATAAEIGTWLADDLLVKYDRMAMAHSLEGRAPYLDPSVVELGLALYPSARMTEKASKVALRQLAVRYLPAEIIHRPKQGFVLPMATWLRKWFEKHDGPENYFAARPFPSLKMDAVLRMVKNELKNDMLNERLLFAILLLVEWWSSFSINKARQ